MKNKLSIIAVVLIVLLAAVIVAVVLLTKPASVDTVFDNTGDTAASTVLNEAKASDVTQPDVTEAAIYVDESDTVLPDGTLSLQKVVLQGTDEEQSPRVLFGQSYSECFLKLEGDTVAICLNPYTGKIDEGTYTYENGLMQVSFGYDRGTELRVILSDDGQLQYIVAEHDGCDLYFAQ